MFLDKIFKLEENWVVFIDMLSKNYCGDSILPIAKELRKQRPDLKFFFCCKKKQRVKEINMADEVLVEKTLRYKYVCSKAKYIISNMGYPEKGKKRQGQIFVNTWHGNALKKTYLARDKNNRKYKRFANQFKSTDIFALQGEKTKECMKEVFDLKDEMLLNSGFPRNDILFGADENFKTELKKKLNLPLDKKIILYCPTWRRYDYKAALPFDIEKMKNRLFEDYVLLLRSHVGKHKWVDKNNNPISIFDNQFIFDGGSYPEVTHLYLISDIFISDYSSAIYDFAITKKPEILYIYDLEEYTKEFGLFFDMNNFSPFPKVKNEDELIETILNLKIDKNSYNKFIQEYITYENGSASKILIEEMFKKGKTNE